MRVFVALSRRRPSELSESPCLKPLNSVSEGSLAHGGTSRKGPYKPQNWWADKLDEAGQACADAACAAQDWQWTS